MGRKLDKEKGGEESNQYTTVSNTYRNSVISRYCKHAEMQIVRGFNVRFQGFRDSLATAATRISENTTLKFISTVSSVSLRVLFFPAISPDLSPFRRANRRAIQRGLRERNACAVTTAAAILAFARYFGHHNYNRFTRRDLDCDLEIVPEFLTSDDYRDEILRAEVSHLSRRPYITGNFCPACLFRCSR